MKDYLGNEIYVDEAFGMVCYQKLDCTAPTVISEEVIIT